jgi:choline dehydrogenase-like flavoprotein
MPDQRQVVAQAVCRKAKTLVFHAHPIRATQILDNQRTGVVDSKGHVHGIDNLYVGGSSLYPSSGHANPTLLAVMLALRLAQKLVNECGR